MIARAKEIVIDFSKKTIVTKSPVTLALLVASLLFLGGCPGNGNSKGPSQTNSNSEKEKTITAINFPVAEILGAATSEDLKVLFPNPKTGSVPSDSEIDQMQNSAMIVVAGGHQAGWIDTVTISESKKYHLGANVLDSLIQVDNLGSHQHGPTGSHSHAGIVSETWLSPSLFLKQLDGLSQQSVRRKILTQTEADQLQSEFKKVLDPLIKEAKALRKSKTEKWLVDHAGTEYLCRDLNIEPTIMELKEGFAEDPAALKKSLQRYVQENPTKGVILTQNHSDDVLALLKELKIRWLKVDLISTGEISSESSKVSDLQYVSRMKKNYLNFRNFEEN